MLKQRSSKSARFPRQQRRRATVETDASSENHKDGTHSDDSGDWLDDDEYSYDETTRPSSPMSDTPKEPFDSDIPDPNLPGHHRVKPISKGWSVNGMNGQPLVPHNGMRHYPPRNMTGPTPTPQYQPNQGYSNQNTRATPMNYPTNNVQYPTAPNMQGMAPSDNAAQPNTYRHEPTRVVPYPSYQYPSYQPMGYQSAPQMQPEWPYQSSPPLPTPPPAPRSVTPTPPREDPEKLRLEAEIAAFKAMEEKAKAAEKQKEAEAQIRKEAEEAFHQRMEDMRLAQEEAKKEMEKARIESEKAARERMEADRKAEERREIEHGIAMREAEEKATLRILAEAKEAKERSRRFKEYAANLEKEIRVKIEMEKRAELAERDAKMRQSEDLERLAKTKMLESIDEVVSLTKKKVIHDLVMDGESLETKDRQGWLIETRDEADPQRSLSRTEKCQLSIPRSNMPPRHATVSTVHSASGTSIKPTSTSPARSWKPEVPEVPRSRSDSDDGATQSLLGFDDGDHNTRFEQLVDRIADAVIDKLMQSRLGDILMDQPQPSQYDSRHSHPVMNPFAPAPSLYLSESHFGKEEKSSYFQGPPPCGPNRRFFVPPKPDRLRGQSIRTSNEPTSASPPRGTSSSSQQKDTNPITKTKPSTRRSQHPTPLEDWLDNSGQFESRADYSEVDTVIKEPSITDGATAHDSDETWKHTDWIQDVVSEPENVPSVRKRSAKDNLNAYLTDEKDEDDYQKAYNYVFHNTSSLPGMVPVGVGF
ncbi:reticulocyte-binding 2 like a [Fusarium longipes]|uniref:Reticulocyte-binding 2 like a n=1 Tax=Fusarium longipes TaxID=694270 RepID=A0A395SKM4_9HYPO|nr:reticulocyte-binding 2 like a [Fusarium longipes]